MTTTFKQLGNIALRVALFDNTLSVSGDTPSIEPRVQRPKPTHQHRDTQLLIIIANTLNLGHTVTVLMAKTTTLGHTVTYSHTSTLGHTLTFS